MTLRVLGNVDEQAAQGRRKLLFAYGATLFEVSGEKCADANRSSIQDDIEFLKQLVVRGIRIGFRFQGA